MVSKENLELLKRVGSGQITLKQRQTRKLANDIVKTHAKFGFTSEDVLALRSISISVHEDGFTKQKVKEIIDKVLFAYNQEEAAPVRQNQRRIKLGNSIPITLKPTE